MSDVELVVVDDAKGVAAVVAERLAGAAREGGNVVLGARTVEAPSAAMRMVFGGFVREISSPLNLKG